MKTKKPTPAAVKAPEPAAVPTPPQPLDPLDPKEVARLKNVGFAPEHLIVSFQEMASMVQIIQRYAAEIERLRDIINPAKP